MPVYEGTRTTRLPATPERAFAVMTDYERLTEWQRPLRACTVLSRYDDGIGRDVEYEVDVKLRTVRFRLRHSYAPPYEIGSQYLEGDFACFEGRWLFQGEEAGGSVAQLEVRLDPGFPVPRPIARLVNDRVLKTSVEDLRARLERD